MALTVPSAGANEILTRALNKGATGDVKLKLFTNNLTVGDGNVVGDVTESTGTGYAAETLAGASWTITGDQASYAQVTFTYTGAEANVYGYYITNSAGTILLWVEKFTDGPYSIPAGGGTIKVTPTITLE